MDWQPIETAPKDGTWIVLGKADWNVFPKARWGEVDGGDFLFDAWLFADETHGCLVPNVDGGAVLGWSEDYEDECMPTHWMPLPKPPIMADSLAAETAKES